MNGIFVKIFAKTFNMKVTVSTNSSETSERSEPVMCTISLQGLECAGGAGATNHEAVRAHHIHESAAQGDVRNPTAVVIARVRRARENDR